jgi:hypothetical protein
MLRFLATGSLRRRCRLAVMAAWLIVMGSYLQPAGLFAGLMCHAGQLSIKSANQTETP